MKNLKSILRALPVFALLLISTSVYSPSMLATTSVDCLSSQVPITKEELRSIEDVEGLAVRLTALEICDFITPSKESLCKSTGISKRKRVCKEPHTATMDEVRALVNEKLHPAITALHKALDHKTFVATGSGKRLERKQKAWAEIAEEMANIDRDIAHADKVLGEPQDNLTLIEVSLDCHQIAWSALFIMDDAYKCRTGKESYSPDWLVPMMPSSAAPQPNNQ